MLSSCTVWPGTKGPDGLLTMATHGHHISPTRVPAAGEAPRAHLPILVNVPDIR